MTVKQILALVLVQYRSYMNALHGQGGRLRLTASVFFGVFWYGLWLAAAIGSALVPNLIGREDVENSLSGILLFAMGYWQLAPLMTLSLGVSLEMRKVTVYPVTLATLFSAECLLRLGTGFEILLLLSGLFIGLATAGSPHVFQLFAAFVLFIAFNVFLSAGVRNLVERLFHRRRAREIVLIVLISCTLLPQFLIWSKTARSLAKALWNSSRGIPYWLHPSGVAARLGLGEGNLPDWGLLAGMVAVAGVFGFVQFRSSCRRAAASPGAHHGLANAKQSVSRRLMRWVSGWLRDPIAALVEKEVKYLWRSPRFRLPFFMGFTFGVIAWVPIMRHWQGAFGLQLERSALTFICLYSFLLLGPVMFLNRFGFDRQATRFYFWLPLGFRDLLIAKNLASVVFAVLEILFIASVGLLIGLPVGLRELVEAFAVGLIALLYLFSLGNHMSVQFPIASNPDRVSRAGMGHGIRAALQFMLFPLSLSPILAAFVVRWLGAGDGGFAAALALAALAGAALYLYSLSVVAVQGPQVREAFLTYLTEDGGPMAEE